MDVHREMGCGFSERVYYEPFEIELEARRIPFERDVPLPVFYKGRRLRKLYRVDYVCHQSIVVELKALAAVVSIRIRPDNVAAFAPRPR
jgi:GxxExxY protein